MKVYLAMTLILASVSGFAANRTKVFSMSFVAPTEADLVAEVEATIPSILDVTHPAVIQNLSYENCSPRSSRLIEVRSLSVSKYYNHEGNGVLAPYYRGILSYSHSRCQDGR